MKLPLRVQAAKEPAGGGGYRTPNPAYSSLQSMRAERQATVAALQARKNALQADMAQLASKQTLEPGIAAEMSRINRDHEVLKDQYNKLLTDREQIKLRGQVESETDSVKFRVIDPPSVSQVLTSVQRAARGRKLRIFYGTSGALFGVFGMLMIVEFIQRGMVA